MLLEEAPEAQEKVFRNHPSAVWFGFWPEDGRHVLLHCYRQPACQPRLLPGASHPDPKRLLEGQGKTMRHIKFNSEADLERPSVRRFMRAAIEQLSEAQLRLDYTPPFQSSILVRFSDDPPGSRKSLLPAFVAPRPTYPLGFPRWTCVCFTFGISRMTIIKTSTSYFACPSPATNAANLSSISFQPST